jgi:chemotaxis family two-component system sensor kinase Cph1
VTDFLAWLASAFDASGFMPRWTCGHWTPLLAWRSVAANALVWVAYWSMPVQLVRLYRARRMDIGHPRIMLMGAAFIFACGVTHLDDVLAFWWPAYRLFVITDEVTAALSVATAFSLPAVVDYLVGLPSAERLRGALREAEAAHRRESEARREAEGREVEARNFAHFLQVKTAILTDRLGREMDYEARMASLGDLRELNNAVPGDHAAMGGGEGAAPDA